MELKDDDGILVGAGDWIRFSFGIPPIGVRGKVIEENGKLFVLTPDHTPQKCNLRSLRRYVGSWYKDNKIPTPEELEKRHGRMSERDFNRNVRAVSRKFWIR